MSTVFKTGCSSSWEFSPKEFIDIVSIQRIIVGKARVLEYRTVSGNPGQYRSIEITLDIVDIHEGYLDTMLELYIDSNVTSPSLFDYVLLIRCIR